MSPIRIPEGLRGKVRLRLLLPLLVLFAVYSGTALAEVSKQEKQQATAGEAKPLVLSGSPNVQVKLGGRIHRMLQFVEDGKGTNLFYTDSDQGPTMLRLDTIAKPNDSFTIGGTIEIGVQQNRPLLVSQDKQEVGITITGRLAHGPGFSGKNRLLSGLP